MADRKLVTHRGVPMIEAWPEKIAAAQAIRTCTIGQREIARIRYGEEKGRLARRRSPLSRLRVINGEFHVEGCDVEQCAGCGEQRFGCGCEDE